jgi:cell wall assembly regulator SMI1
VADADLEAMRTTLVSLDHLFNELAPGFAGRLRPGLAQDAIDTATAVLGLRLPVEAQAWFGWHDGCSGNASWVTGRFHLSLEQAVDHCRMYRQIATQVAGSEANSVWASTWFPLVAEGGDWLAIDCDVPDGASTQVRAAWADRPVADSLTSAALSWLRGIRERELVWYERPVGPFWGGRVPGQTHVPSYLTGL